MGMYKTTVVHTVASTTLEQSRQHHRSQYSNLLRVRARRPISVSGVKKTSCMLTTDQKSAYERDGMLRTLDEAQAPVAEQRTPPA